MQLSSIVAIYVLFWVTAAFLVMPFGVRTHDELGLDKTAGQADSAPANFSPRRVIFHATLLSTLLCGLFVLNYNQGWITREDVDFIPAPPIFKLETPAPDRE